MRILILEDLDSDAELVASVVRKGGIDAEFVIARGRDEFLAALPAGADVIISDYTLPDFDAISAIRAVRASNRDVPVIVVTGTITEETAVNCIREGAADYLLKDQLGRLPSAVGRAVEMRSVRGKEALAKEALRESGSRWRSVAEAASDGIILADGEGVITSWNPEASAIFGYNSEEIVGKPLTALMPERYHAAHTAGLRRFLETGETRVIGRPIELVGRRKDGSEFPVDLSISTWSSGGRVCFSGIARDATQRKRAEDDLRRLNRALQTISDCNQALVRAADEPGLLEAICRVVVETGGHRAACVGYKVDDPGKSVKVAAQRGFDPEFIGRMDPSWDDSDRGRNTLGTAIRTGESVLVHEYQADPRFAAWSSQARDVGAVSVFTIPLRADGALIGALCIISGQPGAFDPEERKILEELADDLGYGIGAIRARDAKARADRDLEASAARLRDLLETVPVGIALVRTDATIVDVNSHMCRMLGFAAKEELKATKANEHFAEPRERDRFLGFLKEGAVSGFEARFRRSDGSLFWGSLSAVYRSGEAERTIILALQDVTERRRAETEQLQNARQHEAVARLGIAALESVDLAPLHSDVVETMARTLGVEYCSVLVPLPDGKTFHVAAGTGWNEGVVGSDSIPVADTIPAGLAVRTGEPVVVEDLASDQRFDAPVLKAHHVRAGISVPILGRKGAVGSLAAFTRSRRRFARQEVSFLQSVANLLAAAVERRRAEEDLARHAAELARSNDDLERFAYIASHDLREPLRMVASYVQLLQRRYTGRLDSEADEYIRFAAEGANRMHALIDDLLGYARAGRGPSEPVKVESGACLKRALESLRPTIEEVGARVEIGELPEVTADPSGLEMVFQNLVGNAVKFRGPGPPTVRIAAAREGKEWVFSVADDGIGIDPQHQERIFVAFQRLNPREKYPGTGIGLAICKRVVERHGGRIWVESRQDKGATFRFTIPA